MRVLLWIVGVGECLLGFEVSQSHGLAWRIFWWVFLGAWCFAGLVVFGVWLARLAGRKAFDAQWAKHVNPADVPAAVKHG